MRQKKLYTDMKKAQRADTGAGGGGQRTLVYDWLRYNCHNLCCNRTQRIFADYYHAWGRFI